MTTENCYEIPEWINTLNDIIETSVKKKERQEQLHKDNKFN